jgi:outer membrane protein assembly factor BamB
MPANFHKVIKIAIFIAAGLLFLYLQKFLPNSGISVDKSWEENLISYRVDESNGVLEKFWSRSGLFVDENRGGCLPFVVAGQEKVFIIGEFDQPRSNSVLALDAADGKLLWRYDNPYGLSFTGLDFTSSILYSSSAGNATLNAHNLDTGQTLWSRSILWSRYIRCFRVSNNLIYAETNNARFLLQAETGEILQEYDQTLTAEALQELATHLGLPPIQVQLEYFEDAVFTADVLIKDGEAFDRRTGALLWKIDGKISNVVATNSIVYLLTKDRKLLGLDPHTGEVKAKVQFKPQPTTIGPYGFENAFYVAVDEEAKLVYAYLGDGAELFAFKVIE